MFYFTIESLDCLEQPALDIAGIDVRPKIFLKMLYKKRGFGWGP